jgi:hypothetical protein
MTTPTPEDIAFSRRIIVGVALILAVLLGSLAYGALRNF